MVTKMIPVLQDPRVTNEFSTAGYRVGHTLIPRMIEMYSTVNQRLQVNSNLRGPSGDCFYKKNIFCRKAKDSETLSSMSTFYVMIVAWTSS